MIEESFGRLCEVQEQPVDMLALIVIEVYHCPGVQELMEEPPAVFPSSPIFHEGDIP